MISVASQSFRISRSLRALSIPHVPIRDLADRINIKHVWLTAAVLFGLFLLNLAIVLYPAFAPKSLAIATPAGPGPGVAQLVEDLGEHGFSAMAAGEVEKKSFSISGTLITLAGDNVQAFEYGDHNTAVREASAYIQKYRQSLEKGFWMKPVALYERDGLLVFYLGTNEEVLRALGSVFGLPLAGEGIS